MGQTLIQRNRTSEAHKLLTSLPLMSFSDFPFLIGFRLLYGSVDGLDEAQWSQSYRVFHRPKLFFFFNLSKSKEFFFQSKESWSSFCFFWKRDEFFSGPGIGSPPCIAKESNSLPQTKWWSRWSFSSSRRCQTGESHSNCRVFFWGRQLRDF